MINCYEDPNPAGGIHVEINGDVIQITSEFVCIASNLLHDGIPFQILMESLFIAAKHKGKWESE